jgi:hypothetical protein
MRARVAALLIALLVLAITTFDSHAISNDEAVNDLEDYVAKPVQTAVRWCRRNSRTSIDFFVQKECARRRGRRALRSGRERG